MVHEGHDDRRLRKYWQEASWRKDKRRLRRVTPQWCKCKILDVNIKNILCTQFYLHLQLTNLNSSLKTWQLRCSDMKIFIFFLSGNQLVILVNYQIENQLSSISIKLKTSVCLSQIMNFTFIQSTKLFKKTKFNYL